MSDLAIAGLLLAAGASTRMGRDDNKLLRHIDGHILVTIPLDAMLGSGLDSVAVLLGHEADRLRECLESRPCTILECPDWREGMGMTLAHGVRSLAPLEPLEPFGVLVCMADLPRLRASDIEPVVQAFRNAGDPACIAVATHAGRRGHPVLFGREHFPALRELEGDQGGKSILAANRDCIVEIEAESDAIFEDIDTPEDLARLTRGSGDSIDSND